MTDERWRRDLKRLRDVRPDDGLLERARLGAPTAPIARPIARALTVVVALAVSAGAGALLWRAFDSGAGSGEIWQPGYPTPPADGYYVLLPHQGVQVGDAVRILALTNLPDGTLIEISTTDDSTEGATCCPPVRDSKVVISTQDYGCYGFVGQGLVGESIDVTITTKPDFEPWVGHGPIGQPRDPPQQPDSVVRILGDGFENLSGPQVREQDDGARWLVANGTVLWPEPRCGGDPVPLFGGPKCPADENGQLQGHSLADAMGEVMGTISQGRMCEFWSLMLPSGVEGDHPWPEFADEWRAWLLVQNFSDAEPTADWTTGPLRWVRSGSQGEASIVDVIHRDRTIASLVLKPLPDHCPTCGSKVVPFWGVVSWQLY
jgi:hypothetical protein